ncbi:MAG: hypothetical protein NZ842_12240, partial [Dehalococcoidia bacterium]|nr:hypothetical protein [Dehalococcoidia bacterium]
MSKQEMISHAKISSDQSGSRSALNSMPIPKMSAKKNPSAVWLSNTKISLSVLAVIAISVTTPLCAQQISARSLSLDEALEIARENNPSFLQSRNDESLSDWDVRQAYAALLPSASVGSGVSWQGPGEQQFGSLTLGDL